MAQSLFEIRFAIPYQKSAETRFVQLCAVFVLLLVLGTNHTTGQAIKIVRPRPQAFSFATLTVTASPTSVSFALVHGGIATASSVVAITTAYTGGLSLFGTLTLYGYFSSATSALTGSSASIPSSDVLGKVPTGTPTSYTAFTQTTPYSGASGLQLYLLNSIVGFAGSRTDNLSLEIDLAPTPQLPAATYTGTITLEAQAM